MKEKIAKFREYLDYIERHYDNVQKAWKMINDKCAGFRFLYDDFVWHSINLEVKSHDMSKLSEQEFTQYRQYFFPCKNEEKNKLLFEGAWENHKNNNDHHWQKWVKESQGFPYADMYLVMNIVDWVAMGFEFGNTAREYYENNKDKIDFPDWAIDQMNKIFDCIYGKEGE